MIEDLLTLLMLIMLQAVLGFDNLLYISLESKRAPKDKQGRVRNLGIGLAIVLRIGLLFVVTSVIKYLQDPILTIPENDYVNGSFNIHSLIVLLGGGFILFTATKEILHMMSLEDDPDKDKGPKSPNAVIFMIVLMNLVFSFDSILSAIALTDELWVMAVAIVVSGLLMMLLAGRVSTFLQKNRMYEVLGLFILFLVGVMLLSEGGELGELEFFGNKVTHMSKTTFYFVLGALVIVDIIQSRYQKILQAKKVAGKEEH